MNKTDFTAIAILGILSFASKQTLSKPPAFAPAALTVADGTLPAVDIENLLQHWVHSSEEERRSDNDRIYRPAGSRAFPPSRFRMAYKFARNGSCEFYFLSPDDAHHFKACRWTVSARGKPVLQISAEGVTTSYRISELSGTLLRLTPLESQRTR